MIYEKPINLKEIAAGNPFFFGGFVDGDFFDNPHIASAVSKKSLENMYRLKKNESIAHLRTF